MTIITTTITHNVHRHHNRYIRYNLPTVITSLRGILVTRITSLGYNDLVYNVVRCSTLYTEGTLGYNVTWTMGREVRELESRTHTRTHTHIYRCRTRYNTH